MTWLLLVVLAVMLAEGAVVLRQNPARRARVLPSLLAGLFIVLAWGVSRTGLPVWIVLLPLTGALVAHGWDIKTRW